MLWDEATEKRLIELWNDAGLSASDIAARLGNGLSRNSVVAKVFRLRNGGMNMRGRPIAQDKKKHPRARKGGVRRLAAPPKQATTRLELALRPEPFEPKVDTTQPTVACLANLEAHHCRWPYGDANYQFCGRERFMGLPYCKAHVSHAYREPLVRSQQVAQPATEKAATEECREHHELEPA